MNADKLLEEIKSKIDIVEFISDYVQLKKAGQNYKGLCPFHAEKTPSFMASQVKQIFHCFGCGAGGDVVSFLMKHETLSFPEALQYLAQKAGIELRDIHFIKDKSSGKRERILRLNEEAMRFFMKNISGSERSLRYLKDRGVAEESIRNFRLGYAINERDGLLRHLNKAGHADPLLAEAGLTVADGKGFRDVFRDRIIFPIFNLKNDPVAFGGRVMDNSLPKYLNSPETEAFKKSETLFAISMAKDEIRKAGYAIIVEGYLDAILCHQYGFGNAVAPLGTALTSKQLQKLKALTRNVVIVFDGDKAGVSAARRWASSSLTIFLSRGYDSSAVMPSTMTGIIDGSNRNVIGRSASSGMYFRAKSIFSRTLLLISSRFVPQSKLIRMNESPSCELDSILLRFCTVERYCSSGRVMRVSISCGPAPL